MDTNEYWVDRDFDKIFYSQSSFLNLEDLTQANIFNSNRHFYRCKKKGFSIPPNVKIHGKLKFPKPALKKWLIENSQN